MGDLRLVEGIVVDFGPELSKVLGLGAVVDVAIALARHVGDGGVDERGSHLVVWVRGVGVTRERERGF